MRLISDCFVIFFCALFTLTISTDWNFQICEGKNASIDSKSVNIRNAALQTTVEQSSCRCSVSSDTNLNIVLKVFVLIRDEIVNEQFPLEIIYEKDRRTNTLNTLKDLQSFFLMEADDMIVAENVSDIFVKLETRSNTTSNVRFVIQVQTSNETEDTIIVNCSSSGRINDTSRNQDDGPDNNVLEYIEDLCTSSPQLVILLAAVCVALLIIILIVAIILCCVMPRKQRDQIKKIRHSMIMDTADTTIAGNNADRIRPEARFSDNAQKTTADDNNVSDVPFPPDYFNKTYQYRQSLLCQNA